MSDQLVTLTVPTHIYERAKRIAAATEQPIEDILLHQLETALPEPLSFLPDDEQAELNALSYLSDDALWTIAREQMPAERQARMQILMDKNTRGTLSKAEVTELAQLVEQGQRLMLRKAQASALLTRRGFTVTPDDMYE